MKNKKNKWLNVWLIIIGVVLFGMLCYLLGYLVGYAYTQSECRLLFTLHLKTMQIAQTINQTGIPY